MGQLDQNLTLQNRTSPIIEQIIYFNDHALMIIVIRNKIIKKYYLLSSQNWKFSSFPVTKEYHYIHLKHKTCLKRKTPFFET